MAGAWGLQVEIVAMGYDGLLDALIAGAPADDDEEDRP